MIKPMEIGLLFLQRQYAIHSSQPKPPQGSRRYECGGAGAAVRVVKKLQAHPGASVMECHAPFEMVCLISAVQMQGMAPCWRPSARTGWSAS